MLRIRSSGVGWFGRPRISDDCPWTTFMDEHVVHGRLNWSKVVLLSMNVFPSSGMILGPTCFVGSGRAFWTNWGWIIFYFSIKIYNIKFVNIWVWDMLCIGPPLGLHHFILKQFTIAPFFVQSSNDPAYLNSFSMFSFYLFKHSILKPINYL